MARKSRKNEDMKSMKAATKLAPPPLDVKASMIDDMMDPTSRSVLLKRLVSSGSPYSRNELMNMVTNQLTVNHQRRFFYRECEQAMTHPYVIGACELLTDTVSAFSSTHNRSVWVTSKDKRKSNVANQLLMELGVEEKIRDWAGQLAEYGDLFIKMFGRKGTGVVYLDDRIHPADMERVDINGRLEGFVRTGYYSGHASFNAELEAPWAYVHGRVYGSQYRIQNAVLGMFGEPGMRYQFLEDPEAKFRITTKYGTSILAPAVPVYKRLKLAEDAVLMARVTRGIMWYLYKIKTASGSFRQAAAKAEEYAEVLKRTTGLNISQNEWKDRFEPIFAQVEDLYVPENGDVTVDAQEYGGKNADIKGVVDVEMLENRLLGSLRVSKAMLGVTDSLPGSIGEGAAQRISINFAKNAYRLQTGLRSMLARMVQVHFAYLGIDPDLITDCHPITYH